MKGEAFWSWKLSAARPPEAVGLASDSRTLRVRATGAEVSIGHASSRTARDHSMTM
jgi:hypothetical protein